MNRTASPMGAFERYLTLWVLLCIVAGVVFGNLLPGLFGTLASIEFASVNLVVAVLIWAMVYPMMIAIDLGSLKNVGRRPKGLVITLTINWLIKPFAMAAIAVLFFEYHRQHQGFPGDGDFGDAQQQGDDGCERHHHHQVVHRDLHQRVVRIAPSHL